MNYKMNQINHTNQKNFDKVNFINNFKRYFKFLTELILSLALLSLSLNFTVLKHLYHFKTEILDLQNNFYTKNNFVQGAPTPTPPLYARPYFSLIKSLAGLRTPPPFSDNVRNFDFFYSFPQTLSLTFYYLSILSV